MGRYNNWKGASPLQSDKLLDKAYQKFKDKNNLSRKGKSKLERAMSNGESLNGVCKT